MQSSLLSQASLALAGSALIVLTLSATVAAETPQPPPAVTPAPLAASKDHGLPRVLAPAGAVQPAAVWSEIEIAAGKARCTQLLKGLDIVALPAPPIRQGSECGAPAPIELVSVGKSPQVTFSPTVTVTCDMAVALHKWITGDLQPLARKHLSSHLIRVDTMSSYSCRTAYGRAKSRLSEHGKANAIDIRGFLTARGEATDVLADWGPTAREIQAQVAAAQAAARKAEAEKAATIARARMLPPAAQTPAVVQAPAALPKSANPVSTAAIPRGAVPPAAVASGPGGVRPAVAMPVPTISIGIPGVAIQFPGSDSAVGLSGALPQPNRLGGPKPAAAGITVMRGSDVGESRIQFLRGAHTSACQIFGTVLGPEANLAHRNHFHVDLAERTRTSFCE